MAHESAKEVLARLRARQERESDEARSKGEPVARELTEAEEKAVNRVENALKAVPKSVTLFFNESGFHVVDSEVWSSQPEDRDSAWLKDEASDHRSIGCAYDTGAI